MNLRRRPGSRGGEFHLARVRGRPSECLAMDLEGLLGELRREGSVDSEGRFTINPLQARQKLQRYQLADPHDYVLLLVSAAIAGGASWLEVQANHERCQLRFDGHHYSCDEMRELFAIALMADLQLRHLSDLALGLNAALLLEPRWVRVQSWDGQAGASLELSQSRFQVNDLSQSFWERPTALNQISVVRPPRSVMNRLRGLAGVAPEHRALEARCCFAPIPIAVNGRSLEQPVPLDECVAVMLCGQPEVRHPALVEIRENHAGLSCALGLGPWRLQVILDGVAFGGPRSGCPRRWQGSSTAAAYRKTSPDSGWSRMPSMSAWANCYSGSPSGFSTSFRRRYTGCPKRKRNKLWRSCWKPESACAQPSVSNRRKRCYSAASKPRSASGTCAW